MPKGSIRVNQAKRNNVPGIGNSLCQVSEARGSRANGKKIKTKNQCRCKFQTWNHNRNNCLPITHLTGASNRRRAATLGSVATQVTRQRFSLILSVSPCLSSQTAGKPGTHFSPHNTSTQEFKDFSLQMLKWLMILQAPRSKVPGRSQPPHRLLHWEQ